MQQMTGAQLLVQQLELHGSKRIFGVPGESYLSVLDALYDSNVLDFVICRQESGAAFMAEAYGKLTGEPGICMVTRGPGATNASAGVHVAFQDSTPMILFIGQVARPMMEREAFQEIDYRQMFGPMAKWVAQIEDANRIPEFVARAYQTATSGRPGPVVLALPEDMLTDLTKEDLYQPNRALNSYQKVEAAPQSSKMNDLANLLSTAQRPIMIVGGSGWSEDVRQTLEKFCEDNHIALAASFRCQDYVDNTHPNYIGHVGVGVDPNLAKAIKESDLIISLGARLGEMTTSGYELLKPPAIRQKFVHIYPSSEELGRVYQPDIAIVASAKEFVSHLSLLNLKNTVERGGWIATLHQNYLDFSTPLKNMGDVQLAEIVAHVHDHTAENAIMTNGAGNYAIWLHRFYRYQQYGTQLAPTSGSMGYGLPAAISAAFEHDDKEVVCFAGDGCVMMCIQELATVAQYKRNLTVIVVNNARYGTIRMHQEREYPHRVSGTELTNPDFVMLARSFGGEAWRLEKQDEFENIFEQAKRYKGLSLIEIIVDNQIVSPSMTLPLKR